MFDLSVEFAELSVGLLAKLVESAKLVGLSVGPLKPVGLSAKLVESAKLFVKLVLPQELADSAGQVKLELTVGFY